MISKHPSDAVYSVISFDGTGIGYRQMGAGPGLVLVHGGMQSTQNLTKLARAYATDSRSTFLTAGDAG